MITRRGILKTGLALGTGTVANTLGRLGRLNALTPPTEDYRALVCIFLFGGNDTNNVPVPLDSARFASYTNIRKTLALGPDVLLPIQTGSSGAYGLHPSLSEVQKLFASKNLAFVPNVGTLVQPLTRAQYLQTPSKAPSNLFSHSDQQAEWQSSIANGQSTTGWGGRLADQMAHRNGTAQIPTIISASGNVLFAAGAQARPGTVVPGASLGLQGYDTSAASQARFAALSQLLALDSGAALVQQANKTLQQGIDNAAALSKALAGTPALSTAFPTGNSLAAQLQEIAKIINVRRQLGATRQIFFCSLGGFDTHTNQLTTQATLLTQLGQAFGAFYRATQEMNLEGNVTTFTESDFSRTFQPNSNGGTDHAWGGHHLVMGGSVKGGELYGAFPTPDLGGPDDAGTQGRWIPTIATDQYGATLSTWFGLSPQLLSSVFPNIGNFTNHNLNFLV